MMCANLPTCSERSVQSSRSVGPRALAARARVHLARPVGRGRFSDLVMIKLAFIEQCLAHFDLAREGARRDWTDASIWAIAPNLDRNILRADNRTVACGHVRIEPPFEPRDNVRVVPQVSARGGASPGKGSCRLLGGTATRSGLRARSQSRGVQPGARVFCRIRLVLAFRQSRRATEQFSSPSPSDDEEGFGARSSGTAKVPSECSPLVRTPVKARSAAQLDRDALLTVVVQGGYLTSRDDCVALIGPASRTMR